METVWIQLCTDSSVDIHVRYYRRSCDRRKRKREDIRCIRWLNPSWSRIHDRCSPALASYGEFLVSLIKFF
ncbi:MAG: hypothetical protein HUK40_06150 [Desulfobacter sp.]|nr:hypothetical protein [Desulfobacter sp.]